MCSTVKSAEAETTPGASADMEATPGMEDVQLTSPGTSRVQPLTVAASARAELSPATPFSVPISLPPSMPSAFTSSFWIQSPVKAMGVSSRLPAPYLYQEELNWPTVVLGYRTSLHRKVPRPT